MEPSKDLLSASLLENRIWLQSVFAESSDLLLRTIDLQKTEACFVTMDNLVDKKVAAQSILNPLVSADFSQETAETMLQKIETDILGTVDQRRLTTKTEVLQYLMSGFGILALDSCPIVLALGIQGFPYRSVGESEEKMQNGSREGFVEVLPINLSLLRRRIKSPMLRFETMVLGSESHTMIALCYLQNHVSQEALRLLRKHLHQVDLKTILAADYLTAYLERPSIFSGIGETDRPDTVCGKLTEGRIAILVDGTPHVLIVPYLFVEHFQTFDDYADRPFYATFVRWIRYCSFFLSVFLPGLYAAATSFVPELIPSALLGKIAQAESETPFTIFVELLLLNFIYEIMREAGLRAPKTLSHAVSIVGALVIGDAAVSSGLIGTPTLMVVALTALSSYVIPKLYEPLSFLRLLFLCIGGTLGFGGIVIGFGIVLINLCAKSSYRVPINAPVSPFSMAGMRDVLYRAGWKTLHQRSMQVQDLPGSQLPHKKDGDSN